MTNEHAYAYKYYRSIKKQSEIMIKFALKNFFTSILCSYMSFSSSVNAEEIQREGLSLNNYLVNIIYRTTDGSKPGRLEMLLSAPLDFIPMLDSSYDDLVDFIKKTNYQILGEVNLRQNRYGIDKCLIIHELKEDCTCILFFKKTDEHYYFNSYGMIVGTDNEEPCNLFQMLYILDK